MSSVFLGYSVSLDKQTWIQLAPMEYFPTKEDAISYGQVNYHTIVEDLNFVIGQGNPGILYVAEVYTCYTALPYATTNCKKPPTPEELKEINDMRYTIAKFEAMAHKHGYLISFNTEELRAKEEDSIRRFYQEHHQQPATLLFSNHQLITFEL